MHALDYMYKNRHAETHMGCFDWEHQEQGVASVFSVCNYSGCLHNTVSIWHIVVLKKRYCRVALH